MAKLVDGQVVEQEPGGSVHRYKVIDGLFEEKGRPPSEDEMAATDGVMTRPPPKAWNMTSRYTPKRVRGPAVS